MPVAQPKTNSARHSRNGYQNANSVVDAYPILWSRPIREAIKTLIKQGENPQDAVDMAVEAECTAGRGK